MRTAPPIGRRERRRLARPNVARLFEASLVDRRSSNFTGTRDASKILGPDDLASMREHYGAAPEAQQLIARIERELLEVLDEMLGDETHGLAENLSEVILGEPREEAAPDAESPPRELEARLLVLSPAAPPLALAG